MPRDGSGIYTKAAGTTAVPGSTIESAKYNSQVDDMVSDANTARPIVAGGTGSTSAAAALVALGADAKMVYQTKSGNYTAVAADNNSFIRFSATATLSLTAAATLGANWHVYIAADFGGGNVTVDPNSTELINGASTIIIPRGDGALIICDGTGFRTLANPTLSSITAAGYTRFPNGIILQWGVSTSASTDYSVTLPVAYTNSNFSVQLTPSIGASATNLYVAMTSSVSTTAFDIRTRIASNGGTVGTQASLTVYWMSVGI